MMREPARDRALGEAEWKDVMSHMVIGCKNCGSHFTHDEMMRLKPPAHPWPLTPTGKRIADENQQTGRDRSQCPTCGCRTLRR